MEGRGYIRALLTMFYKYYFEGKCYNLVNNWFCGLHIYCGDKLIYRENTDLPERKIVENFNFSHEGTDFKVQATKKWFSIDFRVFHLKGAEETKLDLHTCLDYFRWIKLSLSWKDANILFKIIFLSEVAFFTMGFWLFIKREIVEGVILILLALATIIRFDIKR